jgi:hypothetical protein
VSTLSLVAQNRRLIINTVSRTGDKIATMEAKLRQMEQSNVIGLTSTRSPLFPPSLPARPLGPLPDQPATSDRGCHSIVSHGKSAQFRRKPPLPSLPLPSKAKESKSTSLSHMSYGVDVMEARPPASQKHPTSGLPGVRIICKGKDAVESTDKIHSVAVVETGDQ